jgi:hypothetical protein
MKAQRPYGVAGEARVVEGAQPRLRSDDGRRLRDIAARTGRSEEDLLHEALVAYLGLFEEPPLPGWIGAWPPP